MKLLLALILAAVTNPSTAYYTIPNSEPQATCVVTGRVVSMHDDKPLSGVRLSLRSLDGIRPTERFTDEAGTFCIEGVKPGNYLLWAERTGYIGQYYGEAAGSRNFTPLSLVDGQHGLEIVFRLTASGAVQGRIVDLDGRPLPDIRVSAHEYAAPGRIISRENRRSGETGHDGAYRIDGLRPGKYILEAMLDMTDRPLRLPNSTRKGVGTVTYHPNVTKLVDATPVEVDSGSTVQNVDIIIQPIPVFTVRGKVVGSPPAGKSASGVQLIVRHPRDEGSLPSREADLTEGGRFEFRSVRPGEYRVGAFIGNQQEGYGMNYNNLADVTVSNSDVDGVLVTLVTGTSIAGRVRLSGLTQLEPGAVVWLNNENDDQKTGWQAKIESDASFQFTNVPAGTYSVWPHPGSPYFVESARLAAHDVRDNLVVPADGAINGLEVVFSAHGGTISGKLSNSLNMPVQNAVIVLMPKNFRRLRASDFFYHSSSTGNLSLKGIRPGDYIIAAIEDNEEWGMNHEEVWKELEKRGTPIRVTAGGVLTLDLKTLRPSWISN